jgi:hypothetical protein
MKLKNLRRQFRYQAKGFFATTDKFEALANNYIGEVHLMLRTIPWLLAGSPPPLVVYYCGMRDVELSAMFGYPAPKGEE